jgi:sucrose-6-phosphate hydrolase SacC (GH32 family)
MSVVVPDQKKIQFYQSKSLKAWNLMSDFGPAGDTTGIWECPDLFRAPIIGSPGNYKWVLMHSPAPYMQYFVGEFDGMRFKNESSSGKIYRPDYGPDYYAAVTYNNTFGDYTINFTIAMPDVNYATIAVGGGTASGFLVREGSELTKTVSAIRIFTGTQVNGTTTAEDLAQVNVTIFR